MELYSISKAQNDTVKSKSDTVNDTGTSPKRAMMMTANEEPSHGTFSTFRKSLKSLIDQYALISAYTQRDGIHKTAIGHTLGKEVGQMLAHILLAVINPYIELTLSLDIVLKRLHSDSKTSASCF